MEYSKLPDGSWCLPYGDSPWLVSPLYVSGRFPPAGVSKNAPPAWLDINRGRLIQVGPGRYVASSRYYGEHYALLPELVRQGWSRREVCNNSDVGFICELVHPNPTRTLKSGGLFQFANPSLQQVEVRTSPSYGSLKRDSLTNYSVSLPESTKPYLVLPTMSGAELPWAIPGQWEVTTYSRTPLRFIKVIELLMWVPCSG